MRLSNEGKPTTRTSTVPPRLKQWSGNITWPATAIRERIGCCAGKRIFLVTLTGDGAPMHAASWKFGCVCVWRGRPISRRFFHQSRIKQNDFCHAPSLIHLSTICSRCPALGLGERRRTCLPVAGCQPLLTLDI